MTTLAEIESGAMQLPENERAKLAAHLLDSLPGVLHDEDEGLAEALRRDKELGSNPESGMTMEEFKESFRS